MKPEIRAALAEAGLMPGENKTGEKLVTKLEAAGLSLEEILADLAFLSKNSESEHLRLRAAEMALKLHGALRNDTAPVEQPQINIIIQGNGVDLSLLKPTSLNYVTDVQNESSRASSTN